MMTTTFHCWRDTLPYLLAVPDQAPLGAGAGTEGRPLWVSVHGVTRQPLEHLLALAPWAQQAGAALLVPFFAEPRYARYQQLLDTRSGVRADLDLLAVVDEVLARQDIDTRRLHLFGHSGGAQFAHRFALWHGHRLAALGLSAAGWYTHPVPEHDFPVGLGRAADVMGEAVCLPHFLRVPMRLWVGERDVAGDDQLRCSSRLPAGHGRNRLERAQAWAATVAGAAAAHGLPNPVQLQVLPGVSHAFAQGHRKAGLAQQVAAFFQAPGGAVSASVSVPGRPPSVTASPVAGEPRHDLALDRACAARRPALVGLPGGRC